MNEKEKLIADLNERIDYLTRSMTYYESDEWKRHCELREKEIDELNEIIQHLEKMV